MHLLDKNEREMTPEEKLHLEVMRTLMVGRGFNLRVTDVDFDFRKTAAASKMATFLIRRFKIEYREKEDAERYWPDAQLTWAGKSPVKTVSAEPVTSVESKPVTIDTPQPESESVPSTDAEPEKVTSRARKSKN